MNHKLTLENKRLADEVDKLNQKLRKAVRTAAEASSRVQSQQRTIDKLNEEIKTLQKRLAPQGK
jgi:peptidoglycan hydrolase CwlO-like protein